MSDVAPAPNRRALLTIGACVIIINKSYQIPYGKEIIMAEGILEVEDSSFDSEVLLSDKPVLVDFWAPWCGPCKAIGPVVEELANHFGDKIKFAKCNVDDNPVTPGKYGIKAIPTLIFFKGGNVVDQITGMVAKSRLEESINNLL
jgi:thioredoxin 1